MFQVAIIMNNTTANVSLSYKDKEKAMAVYESLHEKKDVFRLEDDFGFIMSIGAATISYILFIDIERSQWVTFEKHYAENKANEEISKKLMELGYGPKMANQPQQPRPSRIIQ